MQTPPGAAAAFAILFETGSRAFSSHFLVARALWTSFDCSLSDTHHSVTVHGKCSGKTRVVKKRRDSSVGIDLDEDHGMAGAAEGGTSNIG